MQIPANESKSGNLTALALISIFTAGFIFSLKSEPTLAPIAAGLTGCFFAWVFRQLDKRPSQEGATLQTIISDYRFRRFSSIGILTFIYATLQGAGLGASAGFVTNAIRAGYAWQAEGGNWGGVSRSVTMPFHFSLSLYALLAVALARVATETYILLFKVAQKYLASQD